MVANIETDPYVFDSTDYFLWENWTSALARTNTGYEGAVVWLTARFLRERLLGSDQSQEILKEIELEAEDCCDKTAVILETGSSIGRYFKIESYIAIEILSESTKSEEIREVFGLLRNVIEIENGK